MQKIYFFVQLVLCFITALPTLTQGQNCTTLTATFSTYESRCAATGAITVYASGGSGSYKYKTMGPVNSNYTTSNNITGLSAGVYSVIINDLVSNCTFTQNNVVVPGTYNDPRFTLTGIPVSCDNGSNGSITVNGQQFGRNPFEYSIIVPSPMGVGTINNTGVFNNLSAGDYSIRMTDSCGGIQTRTITINNYSWWIDSYSFNKISCDSASGYIRVIDSRGNVSTLDPIPGFMYGVVRHSGDTIWSSNPDFTFYLAGVSTIDILAKDGCGIIKKGTAQLTFSPSVGVGVIINNKTCNTFSASLTSLFNLSGADYCLYDFKNRNVGCNSTGSFNNLLYGNYCIRIHSLCPDSIIIRCFTVLPPPLSIGNKVDIYNKQCSAFSADITGQTGLTNPVYCLYDAANVEITCNSTGVFKNIAYGSYCIKTTDGCRDTSILRCFTVLAPRPSVPNVIKPSYINCKNVSITVNGDKLLSPEYCLYNSSGALISCNSTGIFDKLTTGNYCIKIYEACYDTTITRCFNVGVAVIKNDLNVDISNKACSTFTVKGSSDNMKNEQYCLFTKDAVLISCNKTGVFNNVAYGAYCLRAKNLCPDTSFTKCFTVSPPVPSAGSSVDISKENCSSFTAKITNQKNLTNPQYCIFDNNNVQISCNSTGVFNNLNYGSYCIRIVNTCYDTTITRCFSALPTPVNITVSTSKSCSYGYATFGISVTGGNLPVNIKIYKADNSLFFDKNYNSNNINVDSIPGTVSGETYKIRATDNCGNADSVSTGATASMATHSATVFTQCPSAAWLNGSGKIQLTTTTNMGLFTVRIIKKDGIALSPELIPNAVSAGVFTYNDLGSGTYIVSYKINDLCNRYLYDTVSIAPYYYPNLKRSSAYQCDVSGFSVGAVASNGVGPFSYEVIGSVPAFPSINTTPQVSPIFNINNGTNYSLIRLRALDACGNATLGDASILPLANYKIDVDSNCFQSSSTLSVDTIYNSTYAWYKKDNYNSTDSIYLGSATKVFIPFLSAGDTGIYICHIAVNTGCVKRSFSFNLSGLCYKVLPVKITAFSARLRNEQVLLNWETGPEANLNNYIIERRNNYNNFTEIGHVNSKVNLSGSPHYDFIDTKPESGNNFYRLKLIYNNNSFTYSNTILINQSRNSQLIHCYPNPVSDKLTIDFKNSVSHEYKISLLNMLNQGIWKMNCLTGLNNTIQIHRPESVGKGIYILKVIDMNTNEEFSEKIIFL